jgi:hypothetical protein
MSNEGYEYFGKCLAASVTAHLMGNTVEHEMRMNKDREPGELYYALASLLASALIGKHPEAIQRLNSALEGYPR